MDTIYTSQPYGYILADPNLSTVYTGFSYFRQNRVIDYELWETNKAESFILNLIDSLVCDNTMLDWLFLGIAIEINYTEKTAKPMFNYPMYTDPAKFPCSDGYWVSPKGELFNVGFVGHNTSSKEIIAVYYGKHWHDVAPYGSVTYLESLGWIHISGDSVYHKQPINDAQYDTLQVLLNVARFNVQDGIKETLYGDSESDQSVHDDFFA